jgi:dipeptidyl aminopeptidase/acylaminoacyl peptidase
MDRDRYLEALLTLPRLLAWPGYYPLVSRDGKWVAWTWFGTGPAADVFVAPTDGSGPPIRMTETGDDTIAVSWTPDSRAVLVQQDHDGDERAQLFRVDLERPGTMVPLTEASPEHFLRGGHLHPNGRWLVYGANYDFGASQEIEPTWVYRHDLETGERVPLARPGRGCYYEPQLNEQGTHVLYTRNDLHPAGLQVWMVDIEGREDREVLNYGDDVKTYASWHPDGRRAIVMAEAGTHTRVGLWDRDTGDVRWLLDDPTRYILDAFVPHGSDRAVVIEAKDAGVRASLMDIESGSETRLPRVPGNLVPQAPVGGSDWAGLYYSARQPVDLVRFSLDDVHPEHFTSLTRVWESTQLRPEDLAPAESFRWKSVDGVEIQGWLYRPQGAPRGTIVYVHGGPTSHSEDRINIQVQFFVSQGFNVFDPNYRGSTGFSLEFRESIKVDGWGGREQEDIRTGIEALIASGIAEAGKVGITGTSYGGYSAWWAITQWPPDVVAASAPICGMTDLVVDYETTRPDLRPYSEEMLGGSPSQVPERYRERSPINFVDKIQGRLLIVQGLQDPNVTPENVRAVRAALARAGVEYDLLAFEDEGHGIARPKNQQVLYLRLADFFAEAFAPSGARSSA